jgi:hypothetical protein
VLGINVETGHGPARTLPTRRRVQLARMCLRGAALSNPGAGA